jgi:hypothetical protein
LHLHRTRCKAFDTLTTRGHCRVERRKGLHFAVLLQEELKQK